MVALSIHILVVIGFTVRILLREDLGATTRLAWFMVITVVPAIGSITYFLFGEINLGHTASKRIAEVTQRVHTIGRELFPANQEPISTIPDRFVPTFDYSRSINGFPAVSENRIELMPDAQTARDRLIDDIENAKRQVHVLYYIWLEDETGTNMARALMRAAKRGVTCRAMARWVGFAQPDKISALARDAGCGCPAVCGPSNQQPGCNPVQEPTGSAKPSQDLGD